jgi:selenocysteine-specific elongation factor
MGTASHEGPLVIGTAGHVDHGKTALVLALTGRDTDRLPAEKARGISIELGFAPLALPSGRRVSLVDVPGHERFVRHMVAGATGVDGYLLCVAADDGVMPQTREHVAVLRLLGVASGVVAVTRADLADPSAAAAEAAALAGPGVEVVPVCAPRGEGLDALRAALDRMAGRLRRRLSGGPPRLFVDRAFPVAGAGTVVTGTLWGEGLARGDRVAVHPSAATGRVRGLQVHDAPVERADGGRVAVALPGIDRADAPRGSCLVRAGDSWSATERLGVALTWLPEGDVPPSGNRLQAFLGTAEVPATCVLLDDAGLAELRLERPVLAAAGDRVVLRSPERRTVAGARVVDPHPPAGLRRGARRERLAVLAGGDPGAVLRLRLREAGRRGVPAGPEAEAEPEAVVLGGLALHAAVVARAGAAVRATVGQEGVTVAAARAASGLPGPAAAALVERMTAAGEVAERAARVVPPGAGPALTPEAEALGGLLDAAGLRPPTVHRLGEEAGLDPAALRAALAALREAGRAVSADGLWFGAAALAGARAEAAEALAAGPLGIGALRDLWGVGRRHALAIASHLDASGLSVREGDLRALRRPPRPP